MMKDFGAVIELGALAGGTVDNDLAAARRNDNTLRHGIGGQGLRRGNAVFVRGHDNGSTAALDY
jgi:hypothetical protein